MTNLSFADKFGKKKTDAAVLPPPAYPQGSRRLGSFPAGRERPAGWELPPGRELTVGREFPAGRDLPGLKKASHPT